LLHNYTKNSKRCFSGIGKQKTECHKLKSASGYVSKNIFEYYMSLVNRAAYLTV